MDLICLVSKTQPVLAVRSQAPWSTFHNFLAAASSRPGYLIVANSGTGSIWHFNALLMEQRCGIRVTHVPFGGSSASLANLLGGHVDAVVAGAGELVSNVKAGQLRLLAVLDKQRSGLFPDVPSVHELGYPFGASAWSGFFTPKGVPEDRLTLLETIFQNAFDSSQFQTLCGERGMEPHFLGRSNFRDFAAEQNEFFLREIPHLLRLER
jgi:tripartite-type tricarboxylate transporter receptor subunit TctC